MKYVALETLQKQAKAKPIGYLDQCLSVGVQNGDTVAFTDEAYSALVAKFARYRLSQSDPYQGRISGCCDRADQY